MYIFHLRQQYAGSGNVSVFRTAACSSPWEKVRGDILLFHCVFYCHRMTCTRRMYDTSSMRYFATTLKGHIPESQTVLDLKPNLIMTKMFSSVSTENMLCQFLWLNSESSSCNRCDEDKRMLQIQVFPLANHPGPSHITFRLSDSPVPPHFFSLLLLFFSLYLLCLHCPLVRCLYSSSLFWTGAVRSVVQRQKVVLTISILTPTLNYQ